MTTSIGTRDSARSGASAAVLVGVSLCLGFGINAALARAMEAPQYGEYLLAVSLAVTVGTLAQAGLQFTVLQDAALGVLRGDRRVVMRTASGSLLVVAFISIAASLVIASPAGSHLLDEAFRGISLSSAGWSISLLAAATAVQFLAAQGLRGLGGIAVGALIESVLVRVALLAGLLVIFDGTRHLDSDEAMALTAALTAAVAVAGGALFVRRAATIPDRNCTGESRPAWSLVVRSWPVLASSLVLLASRQVDAWALGSAEGPAAVADYGAALRIAMLIGAPTLVFNAAAPSVIVRLHAEGKRAELQQYVRGLAAILAVPALLGAAVVVVEGGAVLRFVYGAGYGSASSILVILTVGRLVSVITGPSEQVLVMTGHGRAELAANLCGAAIAFATAPVAAVLHGAKGVAIAITAGLAAQSLLAMWLAHRKASILTTAGPRDMFRLLEELRRTDKAAA